jgi:hypothetical protein
VPERISNVTLADSGHIPMWDAPERLVRLLIQTSGGRSEGTLPPDHRASELAGEQG